MGIFIFRFLRLKIMLIALITAGTLNIYASTEKLLEEVKSTNSDSIALLLDLKDNIIENQSNNQNYNEIYDTYTNAGLIFYSKNKIDISEEFFSLAKDVADKMEDFGKSAQMLSNIGVMSELKGDYLNALNQYQESLKMFLKTDDIKSQSLVYNNIAVMHQELGNNQLAYYNLKKSYELKLETQDTSLIASALNNLGVYYEEINNDIDSALLYYSEANNLYKKINNERNMIISQNNMAIMYIKLREFDKAEELLNNSRKFLEESNDVLWLSKNLAFSAKLEIDKNRNYFDAIEYLEKAKKILENTNYNKYKVEISQQLANAYLENNMFEKSANEFSYFDSLRDSIYSLEKQNETKRLELMFQTIEKEKKINELIFEQEIQKKNIALFRILIITIILVLSLTIIILWYKSKQKRLVLVHKNMEIKQEILKNQMNPHFVFNVLTSIQYYINNSNEEEAFSYISKFSRLMRLVLESPSQNNIELDKEIELITNYIELEQLRLNSSFNYEIKIGENVEIDDINIPPMMIQPIIENAIKHGLTNIENGRLKIEILQHAETIEFIIYDNGVGIKNDSDSSHKSMSTKIIEERINILRSLGMKKMQYIYKNVDKGTKVIINLPII